MLIASLVMSGGSVLALASIGHQYLWSPEGVSYNDLEDSPLDNSLAHDKIIGCH